MATFKAVVFQGGRHLKKDGTTNVKIRVYHNSSAQYIPTEYFIEPNLMKDQRKNLRDFHFMHII